MAFTDLFVKRPVLALVVSSLILLLGLKCLAGLPIQQYPRTQSAIVTVTTTYPGADAGLVAGFITTPLESAVAQANGIDYMTSSSKTGLSTITVNLRLNYDSGKALSEINTKINSILYRLPSGTQQPVLTVNIGQTIDAMFIGFSSPVLASNQITDYLVRVVQPQLQAVPGVQVAEIIGGKNYALRAWLDPEKLGGFGLTATDVYQALSNNDYLSALGKTKGQMVEVNLTAATGLHSVEEFKNLAIKQVSGTIIRLKDIANVSLGSDDYESFISVDGKEAIFIGIQVAPAANLLDTIDHIRRLLPSLEANLPKGLDSETIYDSTSFVKSSISEVEATLVEAIAIVTAVVFVFLGSWRSVLVPIIAIPLSLVGTFALMSLMGFSINLLTLLALVLAIGLVVDDAIIVVENINRHISEGMPPFEAALLSARELVSPIIAMTIVLIAVFVPIGFQGGLTGALFTEFAFTLVGAVTVSALIALTLSPMISAHLLKWTDPNSKTLESRCVRFIEQTIDRLTNLYRRQLEGSLRFLPVTIVFAILMLSSIYWLYATSQKELAPQEDQGIILAFSNAAPNATLQQRKLYTKEVATTFNKFPETQQVFQMDTGGQALTGAVLKPWTQRLSTSSQLQGIAQHQLGTIAGVQTAAFQLPSLPGSSGLPIQFVIGTTEPFERLDEVAQTFIGEAIKTGVFVYLDSDLKIDEPQSTVIIDRDKTAQMGLKMSDIGSALSIMLGGGYVNYFDYHGQSYKVIPQVAQRFRLNSSQLLDYDLNLSNGTSVPLSTIAQISTKTVPESLNRFQQVNSTTISGIASPSVSTGEALEVLRNLAGRMLPSGYTTDYAGASRQQQKGSNGFVSMFGFAVIIVFFALAALFNNFRDPFVILLSVPMSIAGALIFIDLGVGHATINIYTQVGLVTLMGLISKHGILMVEVANQFRTQGMAKTDAIILAATIRLRPILMTTAAMVLGVLPLLTASGPGAVSRFNMGLVISSGLSIGTIFTLFVVPAAYVVIAGTPKEAIPATPQQRHFDIAA